MIGRLSILFIEKGWKEKKKKEDRRLEPRGNCQQAEEAAGNAQRERRTSKGRRVRELKK